MADDGKVRVVIEGDSSGLVESAGQGKTAIADLGQETEKAEVKFGGSRREIRMLGNELGRIAGVSGGGMLALGGVAAAAFGVAKAVGFLKSSWEEVKSSWKPLDADVIPPTLAGQISAAAAAWNEFAEARAKIIAADNTPQSEAGREEKKLQNELKLIHEVLAAEREKAMIEAGSDKAAQERVKEQFDRAGTAADENNRQKQIAVKENEVNRLVAEAALKLKQAQAIPAASAATAEQNQATLDKNAARAETLKAEIEQRLAMIKRIESDTKYGPDSVAEYSGLGGVGQQAAERMKFRARYGWSGTTSGAQKQEEDRLVSVQSAIDEAASYKKREEAAAAERKKLADESGTESGQAEVLSRQIADDKAAAAAQAATDAKVARLKQTGGAELRMQDDIGTLNKFESEKTHTPENTAAARRAFEELKEGNAQYHEAIISALQTLGLTQAQFTAEMKEFQQQLKGQANNTMSH